MISLRAAAERVRDAIPDERRAVLVDLQRERAEILYQREHALARMGVLEALLRGPLRPEGIAG